MLEPERPPRKRDEAASTGCLVGRRRPPARRGRSGSPGGAWPGLSVSTALALQLLALRDGRGGYFRVLEELDALEGIKASSRTKRAKPLRDPRVQWLAHKHYATAHHIVRNIRLRWGLGGRGNQALDQLLAAVSLDVGSDPDKWPSALAHELTVGGYEKRARCLTGEWILYAVHEGRNFYVTLSTHEEGTDPEMLLAGLRRKCEGEWPFLFR